MTNRRHANQERKTVGKIAGILTPSPVFDEAALFGKGLPRTSAIQQVETSLVCFICFSPNLHANDGFGDHHQGRIFRLAALNFELHPFSISRNNFKAHRLLQAEGIIVHVQELVKPQAQNARDLA